VEKIRRRVVEKERKVNKMTKRMKATNVSIGLYCSYVVDRCSCKGGSFTKTGRIISNQSRQSDEVVIVEWDNDFSVSAMNVNDLCFK
jgi:hypothetical protein